MATKKKMAVTKSKSVSKTSKSKTTKGSSAGKKPSKELTKLLDTLNKKFGENAVTLGVDVRRDTFITTVPRISTHSVSLDLALGGGIPMGFFTEISGAFSAIKSTLGLKIVAEAQKMGLTCAFIDVEGTSDDNFREANGVNNDTLLYCKPDSMEEALGIALDMQKSGAVQLIILDSIAALVPNRVQSSEMDEKVQMGIPQTLLGEFFGKYTANNNRLSREGKQMTTLVGINQLREKIGAYGDPEYTPGGRAKGFYCNVEIRLRRGDWISQGTGENKEIVGQVVKFKITKNKSFRRMMNGEFDYYFAPNNAEVDVFDFDTPKEIIMSAVEWGIIKRTGAWFVCEDKKYQGLVALANALKEDTELVSRLKEQVLQLVLNKE